MQTQEQMQGFGVREIKDERNLGNRVDLQITERLDGFAKSKRGISKTDD